MEAEPGLRGGRRRRSPTLCTLCGNFPHQMEERGQLPVSVLCPLLHLRLLLSLTLLLLWTRLLSTRTQSVFSIKRLRMQPSRGSSGHYRGNRAEAFNRSLASDCRT